MNRRAFFNSAIAFVAALFAPKPKLAAKPPCDRLMTKGWAEPLPPGQFYAYRENGHLFYQFWPEPPSGHAFSIINGELWEFTPDAIRVSTLLPPFPSFHREAFAFSTPRLTEGEADRALDEVNQIIDRWSSEPWPTPKTSRT